MFYRKEYFPADLMVAPTQDIRRNLGEATTTPTEDGMEDDAEDAGKEDASLLDLSQNSMVDGDVSMELDESEHVTMAAANTPTQKTSRNKKTENCTQLKTENEEKKRKRAPNKYVTKSCGFNVGFYAKQLLYHRNSITELKMACLEKILGTLHL